MSKRLEQYFYLVLGSTLLTLGIWLFVTPNQINFAGRMDSNTVWIIKEIIVLKQNSLFII